MNLPVGNNAFGAFRAPERPAGGLYRTTFGAPPPRPFSGATAPAPAPAPAPGPARRERNTTVTMLWVVLAAFAVIAGTFGTLYVLESGARSDTAAALQASQRDLDEARSAHRDAETRLGQKDAELRSAEQGRDEAREQVTELTRCRDATRAFMAAVSANKEDARKEISDMVDFCS